MPLGTRTQVDCLPTDLKPVFSERSIAQHVADPIGADLGTAIEEVYRCPQYPLRYSMHQTPSQPSHR